MQTLTPLENIQQALRAKTRADKAAHYPKYFQAHAGGYGEGDQFLGVVVPDNRTIAKAYWQLFDCIDLTHLLLSA